jgi:hypothetical protein
MTTTELPRLVVQRRDGDGSCHLFEADPADPVPFGGHVASWLTPEYAAEIVRRCNAFPVMAAALHKIALGTSKGELLSFRDFCEWHEAAVDALKATEPVQPGDMDGDDWRLQEALQGRR